MELNHRHADFQFHWFRHPASPTVTYQHLAVEVWQRWMTLGYRRWRWVGHQSGHLSTYGITAVEGPPQWPVDLSGSDRWRNSMAAARGRCSHRQWQCETGLTGL